MAHTNLNMTQNSLLNATTYNQSTGGVTVKPENINGNWNAMGMFGFNTALRDKRFTINSFSVLIIPMRFLIFLMTILK